MWDGLLVVDGLQRLLVDNNVHVGSCRRVPNSFVIPTRAGSFEDCFHIFVSTRSRGGNSARARISALVLVVCAASDRVEELPLFSMRPPALLTRTS